MNVFFSKSRQDLFGFVCDLLSLKVSCPFYQIAHVIFHIEFVDLRVAKSSSGAHTMDFLKVIQTCLNRLVGQVCRVAQKRHTELHVTQYETLIQYPTQRSVL
jgi:hypothetical protein